MNKNEDGLDSTLDTRKLEHKMLLYYTQDGLWDICLGVCVLGWALALRFEFIAFIGVIVAVAVTLVPLLKSKLTYPRIGYARLRPDSGVRKWLAALVGVGVAMLLLVVSASPGVRDLFREYLTVLLGAMGASVIAVFGKAFNTGRFYWYALLVFVAGAANHWVGVDLWLAVGVSGAAMVGCGAGVLVRFLRDNPRTDEDVDA